MFFSFMVELMAVPIAVFSYVHDPLDREYTVLGRKLRSCTGLNWCERRRHRTWSRPMPSSFTPIHDGP
ncbi:hypothetical protein PF008_g15057 [Phytophthora fragariae]|uniref:Secreted protein n=1 Tax=Phytophthora fragariae TaxID=53985 RepID=A0A6G0RFN7_9STRA|nr:hypothetical protein PF008_g15057 [Phytophthora fragariae]